MSYHRPIRQKPPKPVRDRNHLARVRALPCIICESFGEQQLSPTQAHHVICDRHGNEKTCDRRSIPLCEGHHQGDFDTSKTAIHRDRTEWVGRYGKDTQFSAVTLDRLEQEQ